jgi:C_GCAxxG_C_C family probable redox protein
MSNREPALDAIVLKHSQKHPNCAQTAFLSMRERFNIECDESAFLRALTAMPAVGGTGETCGGVSGPVMAIGLVLGSADPTDRARNQRANAAAHQFCVAVQKEFGSTRCGDVIEHCCGTRYDLSKPEEARKYMEAGGLQKCLNVVQTTVHLATGILEAAAREGGKAQAH